MRLALIFVVASLVGCASYPVQTDTSTVPVVREADQAQRRAQRRAERRRTRPQRLAEGQHGSRNSAVSIRNRYSRFGSSYSNLSACNARAARPPLIVDARGHVHGRSTVNARAPEASIDGVTLRLAHMLCTRPRV